MKGYPSYLLGRLGQFVLVVFIGINIAFIVTHATPIDPVEQTIAATTMFGATSPEAIAMMRQSLRELYGMEGGPLEQYFTFWRRVLQADFGPSLSAFPTPVSTLIARALPWTAGLLIVSTIITWILGNLLGGLAGYYRKSGVLRAAGVVAMAFHPIPYYIVAFVLLIIFGYVWPILPISGAYQMNMTRGFSFGFVGSLLLHSILPITSLVMVGLGGWFMGMRSLVSNVVTEDYVVYAELGGVEPLAHPDVLCDAQFPDPAGDRACHVAGLDLHRRHHHGAGVRLSRHRHAADLLRSCRRLQPGAGDRVGLDRLRVGGGAGNRSALPAARPPREGALGHVERAARSGPL